MLKAAFQLAVLSIVTLCFPSLASAQEPPTCLAGTLTAVLGTTCTIGDLAFTFDSGFNGFAQSNDGSNVIVTNPVLAGAMNFTPVVTGNQAGFALTPNWLDAPGYGVFSSHFGGFSYGVQALGSNLILSESATLNGAVTGPSFSSVAAFDTQCYPDGECTVLGPTANFVPFDPQNGYYSDLSQSMSLSSPACGTVGLGSNAVNDFAYTASTATLNSATFLYATGQQTLTQSIFPLIDLGTLGGSTSLGFNVNNQSQVVGQASLHCDSSAHGFRWQNGSITDVGTLGGSTSFAFGVNASGEVIGQASLAGDSAMHAFHWQTGNITDLGTLGGPNSYAGSINSLHQVVGQADTGITNPDSAQPISHAFLWNKGSMTDLGTLGGSNSSAAAINDLGQVVGSSETVISPDASLGVPLFHSFLWQNGTMKDLGPLLGGRVNRANDINNQGQVVGIAMLPDDATGHAFLWRNGSAQDLGVIEGDTASLAISVNSKGQIAGFSAAALFGSSFSGFWCPCHAFVWEQGKMIDLNTLLPENSGWLLLNAEGINDRGEVVGIGYRNNQLHGFLLPLPNGSLKGVNPKSNTGAPGRWQGPKFLPGTKVGLSMFKIRPASSH